MRTVLAACLLAIPVVACSPFSNGDVFNCTSDPDCALAGHGGTCVESSVGKVCAYPDGDCSGGSKIGGQAGAASNQCITADGGLGNPPEAGLPADAAADAPPDAQACFGATLNICLAHLPTQDVDLHDDIIATGGSVLDDACTEKISATGGSASLCVIEGVNVTLRNIHVTGSRPLVVFALTSIVIDDDVTAGWDGGVLPLLKTGPGANRDCGGASGTGVGGGAGGSFGSKGGAGGGPGGGTAGATAPVTQIVGGCNGAPGVGTQGGVGGGAIYLLTPGTITIAGALSAFGEGGGGGPKGAMVAGGGGGGGTGGFIGLEAPSIKVTGSVSAGGGGGGGGGGAGAGNGAGRAGDDGKNGTANGGGGGSGTAVGGAGGTADVQGATTAGTAGAVAAGPPATAGGGGGGGGTGVVWTTGTVSGLSKIAPPPTPP